LERQYRVKRTAIQRAATQGQLRWTPDTDDIRISKLQRDYREAVASRFESIYGTPLDITRLDADHPVDLLIGGASTQRLKMLDRSINRSVGASLLRAGDKAGLSPGDLIDEIIFLRR
jgi:hypothetical protein